MGLDDIEIVALVLVLIIALVVAGWAWRRVRRNRLDYEKRLKRAFR